MLVPTRFKLQTAGEFGQRISQFGQIKVMMKAPSRNFGILAL